MKNLITSLSIVVFTIAVVGSKAVASSTPMGETLTKTVKTINSKFDNLVPLQRALLLKKLGMRFSELSLALLTKEGNFREAVLQSLLESNNSIINMDYPITINPKRSDHPTVDIPVSYLPFTHSLSAEDTLVSIEDYNTNSYLSSSLLFVEELEEKLITVLGDSGRRDILENLNRFDFETVDKLFHKVSTAWSLWIQQAALNYEVSQPLRAFLGLYETRLKDDMDKLQKNSLEKLRNYLKFKDHKTYSPLSNEEKKYLMGELDKAEKEYLIRELDKIEAMPLSSERNKAANGFFANNSRLYSLLLSDESKNMLKEWERIGTMPHSSTERSEAVSNLFTDYFIFYTKPITMKPSNIVDKLANLGKIGQSLLADLTPTTIYATDWFFYLVSTTFTVDAYYIWNHPRVHLNSADKTFLQQNFINILDQELQNLLADKG